MEAQIKFRDADLSLVPRLVPELGTCRLLMQEGWDVPTVFTLVDPETGEELPAPTAGELCAALPNYEMSWRVDGHYNTNRKRGSIGYSTAADALAHSWLNLNSVSEQDLPPVQENGIVLDEIKNA